MQGVYSFIFRPARAAVLFHSPPVSLRVCYSHRRARANTTPTPAGECASVFPLSLPPSLSRSEFVRAVGYAHPGGGSGGSWRGAFDPAQRQIPTRIAGSGELGWRLPSKLGVRPSVVIVGLPASECDAGLGERGEQRLIQQFISSVKRLRFMLWSSLGAQNELQTGLSPRGKVTERIGERQDLGGHAAFRAADRLALSPPFAP